MPATPARSAAVRTVAPSGRSMPRMRPRATGLRTKATARAPAAASAVNQPCAGEERAILAPRQRTADPGHAATARSSARRAITATSSDLYSASAWISPNGSKAARAASAAARKTASPGASPTSSASASRRPHRLVDDAAEREPRLADDARLDPDRGHRRDDGEIAGAAVELDEAAAPVVAEPRQADLGDHLAVAEVGGEDRLGTSRRPRSSGCRPRSARRSPHRAPAPARTTRPPGRHGRCSRRRCRACGSADARCCGRSSGRSLASGPPVTGFSKTTWRVSAPIASVPPSSRTPASPAMRLMSMSTAGRARRKFIAGTRLWPPASTRPSPPCSARSASRLLERARREIFEGRWFHEIRA